jgi:small subunit ribosomal protein S21
MISKHAKGHGTTKTLSPTGPGGKAAKKETLGGVGARNLLGFYRTMPKAFCKEFCLVIPKSGYQRAADIQPDEPHASPVHASAVELAMVDSATGLGYNLPRSAEFYITRRAATSCPGGRANRFPSLIPAPPTVGPGEEGAGVSEVKISDSESFEAALKRFNRKIQTDGILAEARRREHYEKPSVKRKKKEAARKRKARKGS